MVNENINNNYDNNNYKTGYCKPPKHSQFKKGQSGNPKGRPSKKNPFEDIEIKDFWEAMAKYLYNTVNITENGKTTQATVFEALAKKVITMAFSGEKGMTKELIKILPNLPIERLHARKRQKEQPQDKKQSKEMLRILRNELIRRAEEEERLYGNPLAQYNAFNRKSDD